MLQETHFVVDIRRFVQRVSPEPALFWRKPVFNIFIFIHQSMVDNVKKR